MLKNVTLYHYIDGERVGGAHGDITGELTGIRGDLTGDLDECGITDPDPDPEAKE